MSGMRYKGQASGSYPSLDIIYSQEEEEDSYVSPDRNEGAVASADGKHGTCKDNAPCEDRNIADRNMLDDLYAQAQLCRPFDDNIHEVAQSDVTLPTENKNRGLLKFVKVCFSKESTRADESAEPNSFAFNTDDVDTKNYDELLFLAETQVADVPTNQFRLGIGENMKNDYSDEDSSYNLYASTLSRASASTKTSTIGDAILQDSRIASEMTRARASGMIMQDTNKEEGEQQEDTDNQTLSAYSYKRAYVDNLTLGSGHTSNLSTITDDYSFDPKRNIGMAEAVDQKSVFKISPSGPVDMDTGRRVVQPKDEDSTGSFPTAGSFPMPPPIFRTNDISSFNLYENHENLQRTASFGGGDGYVDEESAERFASLRRENGSNGCCRFFAEAPPKVKLLLVGSIVLLLGSIVSVSIGVLLRKDRNGDAFVTSPNALSNGDDGYSIDTGTQVMIQPTSLAPSFAPSATLSSSVSSSRVPSTIITTKPSLIGQSSQPIQTGTTTSPPLAPTLASEGTTTMKPPPSPTSSPTKKTITSQSSASPAKIPSTKPTTKVTSSHPSQAQNPTPKPNLTSSSVSSNSPTKSPTTQPILNHTSRPTSAPTTLTPSPAQISLSGTIKMKAVQDTYIDASSMWQNFGTEARLRVDGSPERRTLIGFDTSALTSAKFERREYPFSRDEPRYLKDMQVLEAKLRLYSVAKGHGGTVYFLPNAKPWNETSLTWISTNLGNVPNSNGELLLGSFGYIDADDWQEVDVTSAFSGSAADFKSFLITSDSSDGAIYASRERSSGTYAPEIVVKLTCAGAPPDASSPKPSKQPTQKPTQITTTIAPTKKSVPPQQEEIPTYSPTGIPTYSPTFGTPDAPFLRPSKQPTQKPTRITTTIAPTKKPSARPTQTRRPTPATSSPSDGISMPKIGFQGGPTMRPTLNPTFPSAECQTCPSSGTFLVAGSNCSGFFRCFEGVIGPYQACPAGTIFNNILQVCDHPYNVTCTCDPL